MLTHSAQNDKDLFAILNTLFVILSVAKYPRMVSFLLICVDFSFVSLTQNDKGLRFFCCDYALQAVGSLSNESSKWQNLPSLQALCLQRLSMVNLYTNMN